MNNIWIKAKELGYNNQFGEYKWFKIFEKRVQRDNDMFSKNGGYIAIYPKWPSKGIMDDAVFESKSIREIKKMITDFWKKAKIKA